MAALPAVLGLDLGTSEAKAALVGLDGRLIGLGRAPYQTELGPDGRAEQDPRDWYTAVTAAVRSLDTSRHAVLAVCGVAQGPTLALVDAAGEPVRRAITWQDRRAGGAGFGLLPKIAWVAREDPASVRQATWLLAAWDALGLWLTGEASVALQGHETGLEAAALDAAGIRQAQVPAGRPFGSVLGALRPAAASSLGLTPGIPVIAGVNDGTASMLGAGLRAAGDAVDTGGTSGGIGIYADLQIDLPGVFVAPAPVPGLWVVGGAMAATGAAVDWLRGPLLADRWTTDELFAAAASIPAGADGLVFLPYLAGERAPIFDDEARGAFVGLTLSHGAPHLARAVLEGAAFALRHVAEPIVAAGAPVRELRLAGRSSPGDVWARIKADVLGVPVAIPTVEETAVLGAAILAAVGVGMMADLEAGIAAMVSVARRIEPDPASHARYAPPYAVYQDLYPALKPSFAALRR